MRISENRAEDIRLAYIGGGSRGWAWKFMVDLAMEPSLSGEMVLYDIDRSAAQDNAVIGERLMAQEGTASRWTYRVADSLETALAGADFVVISILPGTFDEMESDVHMPERLNIWQSVGDTAGPGGMIRALRTIPMFVTIAEAIRDYAPQAIVMNYTNPMTLCVKTLYHVFPEIRAFGCCHEVFNTQELLAAAAKELLGMTDVQRSEVHVNVLGINHFTWFDAASCRGVDLMPVYRAFADRYYEQGYDEDSVHEKDSVFHCGHRVKFDLFRRFGWIAAAGDRHLAEFMPGDEYLRDPKTAARWRFSLTSVAWRKEDLLLRRAKSRRLVSGEEHVDLTPSGEEGVLLIRALCGLDRVVSNVNLPNCGQIPNLPLGAVVETNAVFSKGQIQPVMAGKLPEGILALTMPHVRNHERILRAALTHDRDLVAEAFMHDPLVRAKCSDEGRIAALANDMIDATRAYLPDGWFH